MPLDDIADPVSADVADLTLDEKLDLLEGRDSWHAGGTPRLGIPSLYLTDGPHGLRKATDDAGAFGLTANLPATAFPPAATVANTWNPDNARRMGAAIARECIAHDVQVLLGPGVNIKRNPLCGRNFEYYSEDPLVSGAFGAAFVQGVQGEGVMAAVKHFAANSNEDFRFVGDSIVDERALREIYLRSFERVVRDAHPATVMCAYNALNGVFCSDNRSLLTEILREQWGFDGVVMTDWGATHDRVAALNAGCELDMPGEVAANRAQLHAAVRDGRIAIEALDEAVRRMLRLTERAGSPRAPEQAVDLATHAALARGIATQGAVLLSNDGVLPLEDSDSFVVVGDMFQKMRFQGAGSSLITPPETISPQDAFDRRGIRYTFARGYRSLSAGPDPVLEAEALAAIGTTGTVLFFGGLDDLEESEGFDRADMRLGANQTALLRSILDTGARVVLVLFAGAPVELPFLDELAAVLDMYLPGMHGGEATAALLFGEANPSGKLTESWTRTSEAASSHADFDRSPVARYYESVYVGYRFYDKNRTPLRFPFGHGLSYTTFEYRDLEVRLVGDAHVKASVTVVNTGLRDGAEVVQLYVRNNRGKVFKPDKELRAFARVDVAAGASERVDLSFALSDLSYWDTADHAWRLENGEYEVLVAASAADVRLRAPLLVHQGHASRSPYAREVDVDYAMPPTDVPASFPALIGAAVPAGVRSRRLTMQTRLVDARRSFVGALMYRAVLGRVVRDHRAALALPESLERDARVKNTYFLVRMMPTQSLRSMAMASSGALPHHVAAGIADIAAWHPLRGVRRILGGSRAAASSLTKD